VLFAMFGSCQERYHRSSSQYVLGLEFPIPALFGELLQLRWERLESQNFERPERESALVPRLQ
jgi:hypothetical protein